MEYTKCAMGGMAGTGKTKQQLINELDWLKKMARNNHLNAKGYKRLVELKNLLGE